MFKDLGSMNGSYLKEIRVQRCLLKHGDILRLGLTYMVQFLTVSSSREKVLTSLFLAGKKDGLTGAFNRRHLVQRLSSDITYANRSGTDIGIVVIDLDGIDHINAVHGCEAGDSIMRSVASLLSAQIRREEALGHWGRGRFVVVIGGGSPRSFSCTAQRLREALLESRLYFDGAAVKVSVRVGAASLSSCGKNRNLIGLLARAESNLARSADCGRGETASTLRTEA